MKYLKILIIIAGALLGSTSFGSSHNTDLSPDQQDLLNFALFYKRKNTFTPYADNKLAACLWGNRVEQAKERGRERKREEIKAGSITIKVEAVGSQEPVIKNGLKIKLTDSVSLLKEKINLQIGCIFGLRLFLGHVGKELTDNRKSLREDGVASSSVVAVIKKTKKITVYVGAEGKFEIEISGNSPFEEIKEKISSSLGVSSCLVFQAELLPCMSLLCSSSSSVYIDAEEVYVSNVESKCHQGFSLSYKIAQLAI